MKRPGSHSGEPGLGLYELAYPWAAKWQWWGWSPHTARQLCLIGAATMFNAIWEARVHSLATEMEIRLARVAHWPTANLVAQIEQAGLVSDFRAWLFRNQPARWCWWNGGLLIARALAQETAGAD